MLRRYKKMPMPQLLNESINSTLSRSIITHVTVTLALLALLLFGGNAIHSFTAVMMFGVVLVGTYTSVFIASPILIYLGVGTNRADACARACPRSADRSGAANRDRPWSSRAVSTEPYVTWSTWRASKLSRTPGRSASAVSDEAGARSAWADTW